MDYGGFHEFPKEEVLDAVVLDGIGPQFDASLYKTITIEVDADLITLGADISLFRSLDGGVTQNEVALISKATVAAAGSKVHEFKVFNEPLGKYAIQIANRTDGTYTGTARASK